jgi:hypothetical protein
LLSRRVNRAGARDYVAGKSKVMCDIIARRAGDGGSASIDIIPSCASGAAAAPAAANDIAWNVAYVVREISGLFIKYRSVLILRLCSMNMAHRLQARP